MQCLTLQKSGLWKILPTRIRCAITESNARMGAADLPRNRRKNLAKKAFRRILVAVSGIGDV